MPHFISLYYRPAKSTIIKLQSTSLCCILLLSLHIKGEKFSWSTFRMHGVFHWSSFLFVVLQTGYLIFFRLKSICFKMLKPFKYSSLITSFARVIFIAVFLFFLLSSLFTNFLESLWLCRKKWINEKLKTLTFELKMVMMV